MYLSHTRLLRTACSRICAPLRSVRAKRSKLLLQASLRRSSGLFSLGNLSHTRLLPQPSKAFVIRSFFFEKWLLTHAFGGPKGQNFSCRQACVEVSAFFPLVLCKQRLDLLKYLAVCLDLILISDHAYRASLKNRLRDRCKGADVFHSRI